MSTCANCDTVISPGSTTCTSCGAPQRRQVIDGFCDDCGATLKSGAKFCGQCGSKRWKGPMQKQEVRKQREGLADYRINTNLGATRQMDSGSLPSTTAVDGAPFITRKQIERADPVCTKCGNTMMLNAKFCSNCGTFRT